MATTYCVIIDGVAVTARRERVVAELAFTFKRSHKRTIRMLDRLPHAVRQGVDFRTAVKYETLLRSCGCLCKIEAEPYELPSRPVVVEAESPVAEETSAQAAGARGLPDRRAGMDRLAAARGALRSPWVAWVAAAAATATLVLSGIFFFD